MSWPAPAAVDNVANGIVSMSSHEPGSVFPLGTTTVTYMIQDAAGNQGDDCVFNVVLQYVSPMCSKSDHVISAPATASKNVESVASAIGDKLTIYIPVSTLLSKSVLMVAGYWHTSTDLSMAARIKITLKHK